MQNKRQINVYPAHFSFKMDENGNFGFLNLRKYTARYLRTYKYDATFARWFSDDRYYIIENNIMKMPRMFLDHFLNEVIQAGVDYELNHMLVDEGEDTEFSIPDRGFEKREDQEKAISFLSDDEIGGMRCLSLQTGRGKTFCGINALQRIGKKALIITPKNLMKQWRADILNVTDLEENEVCLLNTKAEIERLYKNHFDCSKIVLISVQTLNAFIRSGRDYLKVNRNLSEFCQDLGFGVKLIDECHEFFHAISNIDLSTNIKINLYLSATFDRSDRFTKAIYRIYFPASVKQEHEYKKYVDIYMYRYSLAGKKPKISDYSTFMGYSHLKYEKWLLKEKERRNSYTDDLIYKLLKKHFLEVKNKGEKCLIFCSRVEFCNHVQKRLERIIEKTKYKDMRLKTLTSAERKRLEKEIDSEDKNALFRDYDIIISTIKSLGRGTDIKNLRTVLLTISINGGPSTLQVLGRLRPLGKVTPEFVDMFNEDVSSHVRHSDIRANIYASKAKNFYSRVFEKS